MEFLLEINTEEMPPDHVSGALEQLKTELEAELVAANVVGKNNRCGTLSTYGTCRRLVIKGNLVAAQRDREEVILGPPKSIAFDENDNPRPPALGFARSQGVSVAELGVFSNQKGEYLGLKKVQQGRPVLAILKEVLPLIIGRLTFPKMMKWGENSFRFSRPIKNILCLLEGKLLPFSFENIPSTAYTFGHMLYAPQKIWPDSFKAYRESLKAQKVILSFAERKARIDKSLKKKLENFEAAYYPDDKLLNKLSMDVEYPYVFIGSFPDKYLRLPIDIISTAMREGQNLFSVIKGRKQLPLFAGVSDGCNDTKGLVKKGNERVLKARLEDARFFWEHDLKTPLKERTGALNRIVFQEELGSYAAKTDRIKKIAAYLTGKLDAADQKRFFAQAAELCKVDLMTDMVREFPSLQGKAGGLYARKEGYPAAVWKAVYEHYMPVNMEDSVPASLGGAVLAIADKMDSIVGVLGSGIEVSGAKDPFGLRRSAMGVCSIIIQKNLHFSFPRLLDKVLKVYGDKLALSAVEVKQYCLDFFKGRLEYIFKLADYRYDMINAVLEPGIESILFAHHKLKALNSLKDSTQFEQLILIAKRVNNILRDQPKYKLNPELLTEKEERELHTTYSIIDSNVRPLIARGEFSKAQRILLRIRSSVNSFFDNVLVMEKNKKTRNNRLALLQELSKLFSRIADYSQIVIAGKKEFEG